MAVDRRMICASVVSSDTFLDMTFEAQALYVQLTMAADNFGFVAGVKRIMRGMGASDAALNALKKGRFVIPFESGVIVIAHWFVANYGGDFSKNDRTLTTAYLDELSQLEVDTMGGYILKDPECPVRPSNNPKSVQYKAVSYISKVLPSFGGNDDFMDWLNGIPWVSDNIDYILSLRQSLPDDVIRYAIEHPVVPGSWQCVKANLLKYAQNDIRTVEKAKSLRSG